MPCYAAYNISVELTGMHPEILKLALEALGYEVTQTAAGLRFNHKGLEVRIENGRIILDRSQMALANEIKRAYSREVIQIASRQYGLELQPLSENKVIAKKRF